jgi:hypothetical protein
MSKGNVTFTFDKVVRTKNGFVPGIKLFPVWGDVGTLVLETKKHEIIDVNNFHKILGHCGEVNARLTGKAYGYEVTGKFDVCEAYSIGRARQENIKKNGKEEVQSSLEKNVSNKIWQSSLSIVDLVQMQRNGKVERKFQTHNGRIRAMMNDSEIYGEFRDRLWAVAMHSYLL